jgi:hypothetical protein
MGNKTSKENSTKDLSNVNVNQGVVMNKITISQVEDKLIKEGGINNTKQSVGGRLSVENSGFTKNIVSLIKLFITNRDLAAKKQN